MKILRNAKKKPIADQLALSKAIEDGAAGFPALATKPTLLAVKAAATDLNAASVVVTNRTNAAQAATDVQASKGAVWCTKLEAAIADLENDPTVTADMVLAMGFELPKGKTPAPTTLVEPTNFNVSIGDHHNEVDGGWDAVPGAHGYLLDSTTTPADEASWKPILTSTRSSCTIGGLTTGQTYYLRVRAFGAAGEGPNSAVAMSVAP